MSLRYTPILQAQPTDGDIVFVRRFTRDPPVRAIWDLTAQHFTLVSNLSLTVTGGSYAGIWPMTFATNWGGGANTGWLNQASPGIFIGAQYVAPNWYLVQSDLSAHAYNGQPYAPGPSPHTETIFTPVGAPAWTGPTSMQITGTPVAPLVLPVYIVQAWRPL